MSITNHTPRDQGAPSRAAQDIAPLQAEIAAVDRAVQVAGDFLAGVLEQVRPTPALLRTLAEELERAATRPGSVAHPELLDPDVYWSRSAWPQAAFAVKQARAALLDVVAELEPLIVASERTLDAWLVARVRAAADAAGTDGGISRDACIDEIASRCELLHRSVERLLALRPTTDGLATVRDGVARARARRAEDDVRNTREEIERDAAHLDRAELKQYWADTFGERVQARDAELLAVAPFRHQELLLVAHEQALAAIGEDVAAMVTKLTAPIFGIGERLVRRLDGALAGLPAE